jgi:hypothetical protein
MDSINLLIIKKIQDSFAGIVHISLFIAYCLLFIETPVSAQTGVWIGQRVGYDVGVPAPLPLLLTLRADSTAELRLLDADSTARQTRWAMLPNNRMRLDTNTFGPGQWRTDKDTLWLRGRYPLVFRALLSDLANPAPTANRLADARTVLMGHSWASDSLVYSFFTNGSAGIENRRTGDVARHCWQLMDANGVVLLILKGNRQDCAGNYLFPIQLRRVTDKTVTVLTTNGYDDQTQTWQRTADLAPGADVQPRGFQTCQSMVYAPFALYPYKQFRRGRLGHIRQVVAGAFRAEPLAGQSGLVRLRFVVNCTGQAGRWELLELDENYQRRAFNPQITKQLLDICQTKLTDWEPGMDDDGQLRDTVCLLTFRLKDGRITDIFP